MPDCKCGAAIDFVQTETGERLSVEGYTVGSGERYAVVDYSTDPWTVAALDPVALAEGHPDHRITCPLQR